MAGALERFYGQLPVACQHAAVSLRGLQYEWLRNCRETQKRHLAFLLVSEGWDRERYAAYQLSQLKAVLESAFAGVPYYRRLGTALGWTPATVRSLGDLRTLPVLEKQALRGHEREFLHQGMSAWLTTEVFSSGTTGTPIRTRETRASWGRRWAFVARLRRWAGLRDPLRCRRASFTGRSIVTHERAERELVPYRHNWPANQLLLSTVHIRADTVYAYARGLARFRPDLVDGYPSAMLALARLSAAAGVRLHRPKALIATAETLSDGDRLEIESAFGARVYNQYAASEPSCFWSDCEHGTMHMHPEYGVTEVLREDGTEAAPGEEGSVVVTSFLNPLMPLVRYRLGDVAVKGDERPCRCGRAMPSIARVVGRLDDILFVPERGWVGRLDPSFKGLRDIVEAQIVQTGLETFRVLLVPAHGYAEAVGRRLEANLREKLGSRASISIELVGAVPRGPNGKFRTVVTEVRHQYPTSAASGPSPSAEPQASG